MSIWCREVGGSRSQTIRFWTRAVFGSAALFLPLAAFTQPLPREGPRTYDWGWIKEPWDQDEKPYRKIRTAIETIARLPRTENPGKRLNEIAEKYRGLWYKSPRDPVVVYGLAYAHYHASLWQERATPATGLREALTGFQEGPSGRTYEYARARFLLQHTWARGRFRELGERLVRHAPGDRLVHYILIGLYESQNPGEKKRKIELAEDFIRRYPTSARGYAAYGGTYWTSSFRSQDKAEMRKAIWGYQKYLQLAPASEPFRTTAKRIIWQANERIRTGRWPKGSPPP